MKNLIVVAFLLCTSASVWSQQASVKEIKIPEDIAKLLQKHACLACHKADSKLIGPAYLDVAKKKYKKEQIVELIYKPNPANWPGYPPMSPMTHVPKEDALKIANWIVSLAPKSGKAKK